MKIVFVTTSLNYPIHWKRIRSYQMLGVETYTLGFIQQLDYPRKELPIEFKSLGYIRSGRYLRRLSQIMRAIPAIRKAINNADLVYAFGLDGVLLAQLSVLFCKKPPRLVCEIHDIRQAMLQSGAIGSIARWFEKTLMRNVGLLVVTAHSYISRYYLDILQLRRLNYFVLENKLWPDEINDAALAQPPVSPLTIGYFGSLRCPEAWKALCQLVRESDGGIEAYVRGVPIGINTFDDDVISVSGITYEGPFRDPEDIRDIYERVSLVWAAGFHQKASYVWARSCRFYNACCYARPIIAQLGTDEGKIIEQLNIGCCVDLNDVPGTLARIRRITQSELQTWHGNLRNIPKETYLYTNEHANLLERFKD